MSLCPCADGSRVESTPNRGIGSWGDARLKCWYTVGHLPSEGHSCFCPSSHPVPGASVTITLRLPEFWADWEIKSGVSSQQHCSQWPEHETTQMSVSRWRSKQTVVSPSSGTWFSHEKGGSTDTCCSVGEPRNYCARWKSQSHKAAYFIIWFMWNVQKKQIHRNRK